MSLQTLQVLAGGVPSGGSSGQILSKASGSSYDIAWQAPGLSQAQGDARYLQLTGGALTGLLTLSADPSTALQAATKQYADTKLTQAQADARYETPTQSAALYLPLTGGTLSGNLLFSADNARDIGASGATRPRDLFLGRNLIVGGTSQFVGNVGIGSAAGTNVGLIIAPTLTGVTQYGVQSTPAFASTATTLGAAIAAQSGTANASFTQAESSDFLALGPSFGVASTVTNAIGFHANNQGGSRVTNAYGIYIDAQSSATATNVGLYNAGSTLLNGNLTWQTDNALDIGASGATRPRDLFLGRNLTVGGTVTVPNGSIAGAAIVTGSVTTTQIADGTIATVDLANAAATNAKLASDTARANLLVNGSLNIWQRGNGPFTGTGAWSADRWQINLAASDTLSVVRDAVNVDTAQGSIVAAACTFVLSGGAGATTLLQTLKTTADGNQLANRVVTLSARVRTSTANAARVGVNNGSAWTYSSFHTGDGTWQTLTVTATVTGAATAVSVALAFSVSCTAYLDGAMLVVGSQAADYAPLHPADDLARCQRYYEFIAFHAAQYAPVAGHQLEYFVKLIHKAVTPTVTLANNGGNMTGVLSAYVSGDAIDLYGASAVAGANLMYQNITFEANP